MCVAVEKKLLTLLEEIKQQGQSMILLQQQILNSRNPDSSIPDSLNGRLPAASLQELHLLSTECDDNETRLSLVTYAVILHCLKFLVI